MTSATPSEPTRNEIYEKVKKLLKTYYTTLNKGNTELALEEYSLNGREIIRLFDEVIEFNEKYSDLENNLSTAKGDIEELKAKIKDYKKFREKLETLVLLSDGLAIEKQTQTLKKLLEDLPEK